MSLPRADCDLLVIGAGIAGLTAAVRALELGLKTIVLEKGREEIYPCNTRQSGGVMHIGFLDPYRHERDLSEIVNIRSGGDHDQKIADALTRHGWRFLDWLKDHGTNFVSFNEQEGYRWCMAPPRALRAGIDWEGRGPDILLQRLVSKMEDMGGILKRGARATALLMENGVCQGVTAETEFGIKTWRSSQVLICDGGFQYNQQLYEEFIGGSFNKVFQRGAKTGLGDGLVMADAAGAKLSQMDKFYGHLLSADAQHSEKLWPYPEIDAIATAGIVIDKTGNRIADEGQSGVYLTNALARCSSDGPFFTICDLAIWEGPGKTARIPANPLLEEAGGTIFKANSIRELASTINVPSDVLISSIDHYNKAIDDGELNTLSIPRSDNIKPFKIYRPPYMAIPTCPGITYTMGGIVTNANAQVVNKKGEIIPGLLAAGATTGGLEGGARAAYIGGLMKSGVFGMIAAEQASKALGKAIGTRLDQHVKLPTAQSNFMDKKNPFDKSRGLTDFPILRLAVSHGISFSILSGLITLVFVVWITEPFLSTKALLLGVFLGCLIAIGGAALTELIRLIIKLLLPE